MWPVNVASCRPAFGAPVALSAVARIRRAGTSPSAGRSTCTGSVAVSLVTVAPSGAIAMSIVLPATRRPGFPASPGSWTTLRSRRLAVWSARPSGPYTRSMSCASIDCGALPLPVIFELPRSSMR